MFGESKLTDPQRREIRQSQRALQQTIRDLHCSTLEELAEARETNNDIFVNRVRFTREGMYR